MTGALADVVGPGILIALAGSLILGTAVVGAFLPSLRNVS